MQTKTLSSQIKSLPQTPGVYLFKDETGEILYIGKAKNLKKRCVQYEQRLGIDLKSDAIFASSTTLEYMQTDTELQALLLEAKLISTHQPPLNVLLKSGQPFVYLCITSGAMPELKIMRNKKQKGSYFGPFLEKGQARKVYDFLIKTFRLKLCKKKIANGCLFYHLGICAGACRPDFDKEAYVTRLGYAKDALTHGHQKSLKSLKERIDAYSQNREFERARELHGYYQAFERVFDVLDHKPADLEYVAGKDVWILTPDHKALFVFGERSSVLNKKHVFYFPVPDEEINNEHIEECVASFYRSYTPPATILINVDLGEDAKLYGQFLQEYHHKDYAVTVRFPEKGYDADLIRLGTVQAQQILEQQKTLPQALKTLLRLPSAPHSIDCFDISHKQGMYMVGSCVRFVDGQPDKKMFRHFHIKTVEGQDDYASLREIVARRYKDNFEIPDLILIDGGKGQLNAVADLLPNAEFASLAKREETVFSKRIPAGRKLNLKTYEGQVLVALRDYAHHFAISFHRKTEQKQV